jgi:hypothetical protein
MMCHSALSIKYIVNISYKDSGGKIHTHGYDPKGGRDDA